MDMHRTLLDVVETHTKRYKGIIDFATKKHIIIYNFEDNDNRHHLIMLAILWKIEAPHLRFSVYRAKFHPYVTIEPSVVVSRKAITNEYQDVAETQTLKKTRRLTTV